MADKENKDSLSTQYKVVINGMKDTIFQSCEGLDTEIEVVNFYEGGSLGAPKTARGRQNVGKITFSQGIISGSRSGKTLLDWYLEVSDSSKPLKKELLLLVLLDSEGKEVGQFKIQNAWPCRWSGPLLAHEASSLSVQFVSFAHEGVKKG